MNISEDRDDSILYLSSKFELDRFTNNRVILSDRNITSLSRKIANAIIVNFSDDRDMSKLNLFYQI